ncbi:MAG TPA: diguanylate cyclase [Dehalococcoidia bacterium]|nr:diguanylate cyclase [Dehalococcoidia bacterium]
MPRPKTTTRSQRTDPTTTMMAMLLPIHSALTLDWLVDATATAAERTLNASHAVVYIEQEDGRLERRAPASDIRRRSQQRVLDALGAGLPARLDPAKAHAIAEALDHEKPVLGPAREVFAGLLAGDAADEAQRALGADAVGFVPLQSAGERIGGIVMTFAGEPDSEHVRLFAAHVACAAVNLRQSQAARETGVIDVVRSVFDARKLESDLEKELARAERYNRSLAIVVLEATNLRLLRERFGRFLTDRLLQKLGESLAQNARDFDIIGAYKESGFTMVLTEASADGAGTAAKRLLGVARTMAADSAVPGLELHLAAGWASRPADGETPEALFAAAERRMYGAAAAQVA